MLISNQHPYLILTYAFDGCFADEKEDTASLGSVNPVDDHISGAKGHLVNSTQYWSRLINMLYAKLHVPTFESRSIRPFSH